MKKLIVALLIPLIFISGCSLFKKDPQKAVAEGIAKFADVKKMSSLLKLDGTLVAPPGEKPANIKFSLQMNGKSDATDEKSPKIDMAVKLTSSFDDKNGSGELSLKAADQKLFVKIGNLNISGEAGEVLKTQLASFLDAWWSMPVNEQTSVGKLSSEQAKIQDLLKTANFFKNPVEEGAEDVQGVKTTKYRVEIDKDVLKKFIVDLARVTENQITPEEEIAIGDSLQEVEFSGALWIGDDDYLHKVRGTIAVQPKEGPASSFEIDYSGWDYGKDVEVVQPEGSKEFNQMMLLPLFSAFMSMDEGAAAAPVPAAKK